VYQDYGAIADACCDAWNALMTMPSVITSITNRDYAQVMIQGRWYYSVETASHPELDGTPR
jgi:hypothetical protein